jgi:hypothetical protein
LHLRLGQQTVNIRGEALSKINSNAINTALGHDVESPELEGERGDKIESHISGKFRRARRLSSR